MQLVKESISDLLSAKSEKEIAKIARKTKSPKELLKLGVKVGNEKYVLKALQKAKGYDVDKSIGSRVNRYNNSGVLSYDLETIIKGLGPVNNELVDETIKLAYEKNNQEILKIFFDKMDLFLFEYLLRFDQAPLGKVYQRWEIE